MKSTTANPTGLVTGDDRRWVDIASQRLGRDLYDWMAARRRPKNPFDRPPGFRVLAAELEAVALVRVSRHALWTFWRDHEPA